MLGTEALAYPQPQVAQVSKGFSSGHEKGAGKGSPTRGSRGSGKTETKVKARGVCQGPDFLRGERRKSASPTDAGAFPMKTPHDRPS